MYVGVCSLRTYLYTAKNILTIFFRNAVNKIYFKDKYYTTF